VVSDNVQVGYNPPRGYGRPIVSIEEKSIEERKFELDAELRRREMVLKETTSSRKGLTTAQASVAGAVLALLSGVAGAAVTAWSTQSVEADKSINALQIKKTEVEGNLALEASKQNAVEKLKRKKFETSLILEAIKTPSRTDAIRNLKFFVAAGFVADDEGRIKDLSDENLPSIGPPSVLGNSNSSDRDPLHLHPELRNKVALLLQNLKAEGLQFEIVEGFRSPTVQLAFFAEGRLGDGPRVTNAKPWSVMHNFGLAADLVQIKDGKPYWGPDISGYKRMHAIARELGLKLQEAPFADMPHVELDNVSMSDLRAGKYPSGGDSSWANHLAWTIQNWTKVVSAIQAWGPDLPKAPTPPSSSN
jgi:hypothetical protein